MARRARAGAVAGGTVVTTRAGCGGTGVPELGAREGLARFVARAAGSREVTGGPAVASRAVCGRTGVPELRARERDADRVAAGAARAEVVRRCAMARGARARARALWMHERPRRTDRVARRTRPVPVTRRTRVAFRAVRGRSRVLEVPGRHGGVAGRARAEEVLRGRLVARDAGRGAGVVDAGVVENEAGARLMARRAGTPPGVTRVLRRNMAAGTWRRAHVVAAVAGGGDVVR